MQGTYLRPCVTVAVPLCPSSTQACARAHLPTSSFPASMSSPCTTRCVAHHRLQMPLPPSPHPRRSPQTAWYVPSQQNLKPLHPGGTASVCALPLLEPLPPSSRFAYFPCVPSYAEQVMSLARLLPPSWHAKAASPPHHFSARRSTDAVRVPEPAFAAPSSSAPSAARPAVWGTVASAINRFLEPARDEVKSYFTKPPPLE